MSGMRFASLNNSNARDYAQAGKSVADSASDSFLIMRRSGPDYEGLSKVAMNTRSAEKIAAMKAQADVATAGIKAVANVTETGMNTKAGMKLVRDKADRVRMAGKVAGVGAVLGGAVMAATNQDDDDKSWREKHYALQDELLKKQIAKLDQDNYGEGYPKPPEASAPPEMNVPTPSGSTGGGSSSGGSEIPGVAQQGEGWSRLSRVIRHGEGTTGDAGYTTMFTGKRFSDLSRHPDVVNVSGRYRSSAAGAYQFLTPTWNRAKNALKLPDFSPSSQEAAGRWLTQQRGVNPDAIYKTKAEFAKAIDRLAPEWASMPTLKTGTSYYGQGGINIDKAWQIYNQ